MVDTSLWLFDAAPTYRIARELIVTASNVYDATHIGQVDETSERAAASERGALDDAFS